MLKIRLQRTGRKHEPTFRVVLTESQNGPKSGKFLEILGAYDARDKNETVLKTDRITHWIAQGASPSDTVHNLLVSKGVIKGEKINVLPKKSPIKKEGEEEENTEAAPAPAEGEADVSSEASSDSAEAKEEAPAEEVKEETPSEESAPEAPAEESKEEEKKEEEKVEEKEEAKEEAPAEEEKKEESAE